MRISAKPAANDPATRYACQALDGKIVAGELVKAACARHLKDLDSGSARGLRFDVGKAKHHCGFFPAVLTVTEGSAAGKPFNLLPWHAFTVASLFGWQRADGLRRFRMAWLETGKGQAKALALDTPIPTPTGWTTMGEIQTGDAVLDENGKPCRVLKAHEILTDRECYRVTFDDGSTVVADAGHLWQTEMRKSGNGGHGDATRRVPLAQRGKWRKGIRTTAEIAATLRYRNGQYLSANHSVALAGALDLPEAGLSIPPYLLGFWLGDGDSDCPRVTISDADAAESIAALRSAGAIVGERKGQGDRAGRYRIGIEAASRTGLQSRLNRLGLIRNKHIPAIYLRASRAQRLALLQGLMDTDGTVSGGQCSFCNTNEALTKGVHELALSLGLKATLITKRATLNGQHVGASYHVNFYASGTQVFRLARKQGRVAHVHGRRRLSGDRKIVGCERIAPIPVRCISVDSPSQMFLCGQSMIPTHNSPLMAGIGIDMMGFAAKERSEVYAIAGDKDQANVLFKDAVAMCRANLPGRDEDEFESLESRGDVVIRGTGDHAWKIEHPATSSKFMSMASVDSISGPRPYAVLADEIHEFKTAYALQIWKAAIDKMSGDPLMVLGTNTPASNQIVGTEYSELFQKVVTDQAEDDSLFGFIARVDKNDRETVFDNEAVWEKALPALGVTYPIDNIRKRVATAKLMLSEALATKRLYFGIPVGTEGFWTTQEAWESCLGTFDEADLLGAPCWLGLDLSKKNDLTALTACWRKDDKLYVKTWYFTTKSGIHDRARDDNAPYDQWADQGFLAAVPGATIDYEFVANKVKGLVDAGHDVRFLAFDPAKIDDFIDACGRIDFAVWKFEGPDESAGDGLMLVRHGQGTRIVFVERALCMPKSIEKLEDAILNGSIIIDKNPVTTMCASNAIIVADPMNNRAFDKRRSRGRIDGMVSIAQAVGAAHNEFEAVEPTSPWDDPAFSLVGA
ncbi:MAG TPA: terminase TerL endonuclease subunit [Pseudolabrys sp.]|nr:terminase TerL endonuclease subunit [Pseudolabrys sp.]